MHLNYGLTIIGPWSLVEPSLIVVLQCQSKFCCEFARFTHFYRSVASITFIEVQMLWALVLPNLCHQTHNASVLALQMFDTGVPSHIISVQLFM